MRIKYSNNKIEKQCTELKKAKKYFPDRVANKLHKLINFIENSESLKDIISFGPYNFHKLSGKLKNYYALDIDGRTSSYRLIVLFENQSTETVFTDSTSIKLIEIKEVSKHYE